jgi:hypothetical protein
MAEVSVLYDREGRTLTVWFSDPHEEHVCSIPDTDRLRVALETTPA